MPANLYGLSPDDIRYAPIQATNDGDNTVVAATAGKRILVIGYSVAFDAAGTLTIKSDAAGATHAVYEATSAWGGTDYSGGPDAPAFETTSGAALVFNCSAGLDVTGHLAYVLI